MARGRPSIKEQFPINNYLEKMSYDVKSTQSKVSIVLGALIILVLGILVFNYFRGGKETLGPAQQTETTADDVSPENLPGKYTVKEGDTLFLIAEKYYKDGFKYPEIAKANNLTNVNAIEKGQVLEIPKLTQEVAEIPSAPSPSLSPLPSPSPLSSDPVQPQVTKELGKGGGDTTIWGSKIEGDTYTVVEGDWLSKIAARAYGDIFAYKKLADANNISNPDLIFPGQVIKIPR
ncbi:MAG: LysM peptidoglycan-binding domain-containing protein [Patescibacteria group bacterium]